jgi:acyl-CoA thioesterase I
MHRALLAPAVLVAALLVGCSSPEEASPTMAPIPTMTTAATPTPSPTPSASPSPEPPTPTPSPIAAAGTYLALGDSLAVGAGASRPDETGYVARLHRALSEPNASPRVIVLRNLAIGGETSSSMRNGGQLAAALDAIADADPPIALVTLDIGGNDLLRLLGTAACAADPLGAECLRLLAVTLAEFGAVYRQVLDELASALDAHAPSARLAVMTYFNPFSGTDASLEAAAELALLGTDGRLDCGADDPQARGMNDIIACLGEEHGALVVDVQPAFAGLGLELTHIASEDIHANDRGYEVIADLFVAALASD